MMKLLLLLAALSFCSCRCGAFLTPSSSIATSAPTGGVSHAHSRGSSRLHGIQEWRDQALESKYTLDAYQQSNPGTSAAVPAVLPILPFPFSDILLQGEREQLNLYEQRFHELFQDALDNHCGMVGMGLLAGNGMITTLPLCEVESFSRFGAEEDWVDRGDGMGNGSIFVTIRAVGRVKIVEPDLLQEEPYMKARVAELLDDDVAEFGLKEKGSSVSGESSPLSVASSVANNIEVYVEELAEMEKTLKEVENSKKKEEKTGGKSPEDYISAADDMSAGKASNYKDGEVMNRRLVNAQLESLFMKSGSAEGVDVENSAGAEGAVEEDMEEDEDDMGEDEMDDTPDRVAQFREAFESAKETDTFGYVLQPSDANDDLSQKHSKQTIRTPKELTAISWAAYCTGETNDIQREVMKIKALDMTDVMQRLQLASAMLREEKKKWKAKLALARVSDSDED
ncbi:hypothetical protein ACHAXT_001555 [Thalassiosira profunda]